MDPIEQLADISLWSSEEFSQAELGNRLRVDRLVAMAAAAARRPGGKVTEVFLGAAEREAAYRFVESEQIEASRVGMAAHVACAQRCEGEDVVFVPVDGSSLSLADPQGKKEGLGPVGNRSKRGRGLEVMNAIAVRVDGTPLGLCGQAYWARSEQPSPKRSARPLQEKETRFWFNAIQQTLEAFVLAGSCCVPWFQLDRGGDFREMLAFAAQSDGVYVTVRAAQDRRVSVEEKLYLWEAVKQRPPLGHCEVQVTGRQGRTARQAHLEVRMASVDIRLQGAWLDKKTAPLTAVQVREVGTAPAGEKPIEWMLLTNYTVTTFKQALLVVYGYAQRWKVEEFHKTWKSVCKVEETQLAESTRVVKWAIILAAVAMRIERLKYLGRTDPQAPATVELHQDEIDTLIVLRRPHGFEPGDVPPIGLAVRWIADLGGYTGKSSGGPPGSIVIARGLYAIALAVQVYRTMRQK